MVKKNVKIVGIEARKTRDIATKLDTVKYYAHGIHSDANMQEGVACFSGKVPDDMLPYVAVGETYDVVFRTFNGFVTCEGFYHVQ